MVTTRWTKTRFGTHHNPLEFQPHGEKLKKQTVWSKITWILLGFRLLVLILSAIWAPIDLTPSLSTITAWCKTIQKKAKVTAQNRYVTRQVALQNWRRWWKKNLSNNCENSKINNHLNSPNFSNGSQDFCGRCLQVWTYAGRALLGCGWNLTPNAHGTWQELPRKNKFAIFQGQKKHYDKPRKE